VRYIVNSPSIKIVLARTVLVGLLGGAILALLPLVARDRLHGGAGLYGVMLGAFGIGAVLGALNLTRLRKHLGAEAAISVCTIAMGAGFAAVAVSRTPVWTMAALVVAGSGWTLAWTLLNIGVQLSAPRWVSGRALAAYQAASSGGIALGAWGWGHLTDLAGVKTALLTAGVLMLASPLIGLWLRMPRIGARGEETVVLDDPEVRLELTGRSGPVVVEIEYRVEQNNALAFHHLMHDVQMFRQRNGAYGWAIARDVADPELWTERYRCPTWFDYLRQRNRATRSETATEQQAIAFHIGPGPVRVRRMLERPFGSVRSKDHTIDTVPRAETTATRMVEIPQSEPLQQSR
jgi:Transmembrane secretion effector